MPKSRNKRPREIGACGNYCAGCQDFLALQNNDNLLREQIQQNIAKEMGFNVPLDEVGCEGCWGRSKTPFKVHYYTKTLTQIMAPIIKSEFKILEIDEPLPNEECKKISTHTYESLMQKPSFLFLTLQK